MLFHGKFLKWYTVDQTAFNVWYDYRDVPQSRGRKFTAPRGLVLPPTTIGLGSQYRKFPKVLFILGFSVWRFFILTSMYQNATLILKLEGPIRIPNDCTLELSPGHPGVCRVGRANTTNGGKSLQQGSEQSLSLGFG